MAWKVMTIELANGATSTYTSAGDYAKVYIQAGDADTTIKGSIDGTNVTGDLLGSQSNDLPKEVINYPFFVCEAVNGADTVRIAERVKDPS